MNRTIRLLKTIGSPYLSSDSANLVPDEAIGLFEYSVKNRLPLLYLNSLKERGALGSLVATYEEHYRRYWQTFDAMYRISQTLTNANIMHALFKTLRPYISTTVDIDIVVFGDNDEYERAVRATRNAKYQMLPRGPMSTTFRDPLIRIGVDLYNEIAVSRLVYVDKTKLTKLTVETELSNKRKVRILTREADLLTLIAHSIIKENMYTLSEFFTYIYYLKELDVELFLKLVTETNLASSVRVHTEITALLYEAAYGTTHPKLTLILDTIGSNKFESSRAFKNALKMPHKYHLMTLIRCLTEITRERKTRRSIAYQIMNSMDRKFLIDFLGKFGQHVVRETY